MPGQDTDLTPRRRGRQAGVPVTAAGRCASRPPIGAPATVRLGGNVGQALGAYCRARDLADAKRWPEALDEATLALPLATDHGSGSTGRVHLTLGRAHSALGATDEAHDHLTRAVKLLKDGDAGAKSELAALDA